MDYTYILYFWRQRTWAAPSVCSSSHWEAWQHPGIARRDSWVCLACSWVQTWRSLEVAWAMSLWSLWSWQHRLVLPNGSVRRKQSWMLRYSYHQGPAVLDEASQVKWPAINQSAAGYSLTKRGRIRILTAYQCCTAPLKGKKYTNSCWNKSWRFIYNPLIIEDSGSIVTDRESCKFSARDDDKLLDCDCRLLYWSFN